MLNYWSWLLSKADLTSEYLFSTSTFKSNDPLSSTQKWISPQILAWELPLGTERPLYGTHSLRNPQFTEPTVYGTSLYWMHLREPQFKRNHILWKHKARNVISRNRTSVNPISRNLKEWKPKSQNLISRNQSCKMSNLLHGANLLNQIYPKKSR